MKNFVLVLLAFFLTSCAPARWDAPIEKNLDLVWPPPPNPPRAHYLGELSSFAQVGKSFKTIIFGKSDSGVIQKPVAIAVGSDGRIAIADAQRRGVHLYIPEEQKYRFISTFGRENMVSPVSVAFGRSMELYVSDSVLGKVLVYENDGAAVRDISAAGSDKFKRPTGLVYHAMHDLLYVVDTLAHKIHIFDGQGVYQQSFGGRGVGNGEFNMPTHIATDRQGKVYVSDAMNFRLQIFSPPDLFFKKFGHHGDGSGDFAMPKGVAVDGAGSIYVSEILFDLVQVFNIEGRYLMGLGSKGEDPGQFWMPSGLFIDHENILYVCDTYNHRVQLFQLTNGVLGVAK